MIKPLSYQNYLNSRIFDYGKESRIIDKGGFIEFKKVSI
jgi:hypothetical protein